MVPIPYPQCQSSLPGGTNMEKHISLGISNDFYEKTLKNGTKTIMYILYTLYILVTASCLLGIGYQILAGNSWRPDSGYQILATRSWLLYPGYQLMVTRFLPPDPG